MKYFILPIVLLVSITLNGCSLFVGKGPQSAPNGNVYWADVKCYTYKYYMDRPDIDCYDYDGNYTGKRYPMTQQQLNLYYHNQQMAAQQQALYERSRPRTTNCFGTGYYATCSTY